MKKLILILLILLFPTITLAATLAATTSGNFTAQATWQLCDSTSEADAYSTQTVLTTSYKPSQNFIPGAIEIDAFYLKVTRPYGVGVTGTITAKIYNVTDVADVGEVTIDLANMYTGSVSLGYSWYCFHLASPVTLIAGKSYNVQAKTNAINKIYLARTSTADDWLRQLRTTTTQAPAAGDKLIITDEIPTDPGAVTEINVTMDETAATIYGNAAFTVGNPSITISGGGTLTYGIAASTDYLLKMAGMIVVSGGGTLNIGTTGTPIPATSSGTLLFSVATNVDSGLYICGGTVTLQGTSRWGTNYYYTLLAADAAAAATSLTTTDSTGWLDTEVIAIASTSRDATECESKALTANAIGTGLTITAITDAHDGDSPTQAELANLTRNVKIMGTDATHQTYIYMADDPTIDWDWAEFAFLGSATADKRGIETDISTLKGTMNIQYCSFHDFLIASSVCLFLNSSTLDGTTVISKNVFYKMANTIIYISLIYGDYIVSNNVLVSSVTATNIIQATLTYSSSYLLDGNRIIGSGGSGIYLAGRADSFLMSNTVIHSNAVSGIYFTGFFNATIDVASIWRNNSIGINVGGINEDIIIDSITEFGCTNYGMYIPNSCLSNTIISNSTFDGEVGYSQNSGVLIYTGSVTNTIFDKCEFGTTVTNTAADLYFYQPYGQPVFRDCSIGTSGVVFYNASPYTTYGDQQFYQYDQTVGDHRIYRQWGTITSDAVIFDSGTYSMRMTPSSATYKLESLPIFKSMVSSGNDLNITVKVRESVVGDGTDYNGSRIRLIVKANATAGINADTVLDTATASSEGAWEVLTGAVVAVSNDSLLEFVVDCDGDAGWVNADTITVTDQYNTKEFDLWWDNGPEIYSDNESGGSGGSYVF